MKPNKHRFFDSSFFSSVLVLAYYTNYNKYDTFIVFISIFFQLMAFKQVKKFYVGN